MTALSVVICTYNRAISLTECLRSVVDACVESAAPVEVVVVDNNSADATPAVVAAAAAGGAVPLRYVFEGRQGLAQARNTGIAAARGALVAFTDDDVVVAPDWIARLLEAFADDTVMALGGPIAPRWEGAAPRWMAAEFHRHLAILDLGEERRRLTHADIWGANFAVRSEAFVRHGGFRVDLGRIGEQLFAGEESEFLSRLIAAGERVDYVPTVRVEHRIGGERLHRRYVLRHELYRGLLNGRHHHHPGLPRWSVRQLAEATAAAALPGRHWLTRLVRLAYWLGFCMGCLSRGVSSAPARNG